MMGSGPPADHGYDLSGHLKADVDVYVPADDPGVIYVRSSGTWFRYERSDPRAEAAPTEAINGGNGSVHESPRENLSLHWAGQHSGSSQELIRDRRPRVYYDPHSHPGLFVTDNGGRPTAPLPALEMNGHLEDSEPWLDPATGKRFTCDQARTLTAILKYAPRKDKSTTSAGEEASKDRLTCIGESLVDIVTR
ncbi:hypothetical protein [Arthrobacter sp. Z4-13]